MSTRKDLKELIERAQARGWRIVNTNGGHYKFTHPAVPGPIYGGGTISDHRGMKNLRAMLIRAEREMVAAQAEPRYADEEGEAPGTKLQASGGISRAVALLLADMPAPRYATEADVLEVCRSFARRRLGVWDWQMRERTKWKNR